MSLVLYAFPPSPRAFKVLFALHQMEIPYRLEAVNLMKGEHRTPDFVARNPNARMPVLEDGDFVLWESNAILEYLAAKHNKTDMLPADAKSRASVLKWLFWESSHFDPACQIFVFERFVKGLIGQGSADPQEIARGEDLMRRLGPVLEGVLKEHRYVAGDHLSLADLALGAHLTMSEAAQFPLHEHRHIARWQIDLTALPGWAAARNIQASFTM